MIYEQRIDSLERKVIKHEYPIISKNEKFNFFEKNVEEFEIEKKLKKRIKFLEKKCVDFEKEMNGNKKNERLINTYKNVFKSMEGYLENLQNENKSYEGIVDELSSLVKIYRTGYVSMRKRSESPEMSY